MCSGTAAYVDRMADKLDSAVSGEDRGWLLHCMGSLCKLTDSQVAALLEFVQTPPACETSIPIQEPRSHPSVMR